MGRWEPGARQRLEQAALELFAEHGFDEVTVPQITARAGLTTRTFFRHFADKREVLFADADDMPALAARLVDAAPAQLGPIEVVAHGLPTLASSAFEGRFEQILQRKAVMDGNPGLRERELRKMEDLVGAIARALQGRGVDEVTAAITAETAVAVVKVSLGRWIESGGQAPLATLMAETLARLTDAFAHSPYAEIVAPPS